MPSTDAFTSTASAVSSAVASLTDPAGGSSTITPQGFFMIRATSAGITISKAPSLHGTQATLTFPLSRQDALALAKGLLQVAT